MDLGSCKAATGKTRKPIKQSLNTMSGDSLRMDRVTRLSFSLSWIVELFTASGEPSKVFSL